MDLLKSKKFQAALAGLIVAIAGKFGLELDETALLAILSPILVYIAGQAVADLGKEKEKVANEVRKDISDAALRQILSSAGEENK